MRHDGGRGPVSALRSSKGELVEIRVTVNGSAHEDDVEPRTLLVHYVRETLGLLLGR